MTKNCMLRSIKVCKLFNCFAVLEIPYQCSSKRKIPTHNTCENVGSKVLYNCVPGFNLIYVLDYFLRQ